MAEQEALVAEQEVPLEEHAPQVAEEYFGWSSSSDEGERNLENDEDTTTTRGEDESPQLHW
jgi:hypothetical protein